MSGDKAQARHRRATLIRLIAFFAVTGTLTFLIATQIARISFAGGYEVTAVFEDATGLTQGDIVKIAGAPVGQVKSIKVKRGKAEVELTVEEKYQLPADSEAAIRWRSAVGQRVVYLIPGTSQQKMRDGATISKTRSVVDIGELVNQLAPLVRSLKPEQLNQILTAIYMALDGNKENIHNLIANVDTLTSTIAARKSTLHDLLEDFNTVTAIVAKRDEQIGTMVDQLSDLSGAFVRNQDLVDKSLAELATMFETADKLVGDNGDQLQTIVDKLSKVTGGTNRNLAQVQQIFKLAGPKLQRLFDILDEGEFVIGAVPCITLIDGPCPYPVVLKDYRGQVKSPQAARALMLGGARLMAIKSFRDRNQIIVGLISLAVLGALTLGTFVVGSEGLLKSRYSMSGIFEDTGALRDGNDVLVAGVRVGEITKVAPNFTNGTVLIEWKVDESVDLGPDTRAEIRMANILGGRYLRLTGPVASSGPYLADLSPEKRRIPMERTEIPTTVNDVLKEGTQALEGLDGEMFDKVLQAIGGISEESKTRLERSFKNLNVIAQGVSNNDAKIEELLTNSERVIGLVRSKDKQLSQLVRNAQVLIAALEKRKTELSILLGSGDEAVTSITELINTRKGALTAIINDLSATMGKLGPQAGEINEVLAWAGPTLSGFASITDQGRFIDTIFAQMGQVSPSDLGNLVALLKESQKK